MYKYPEDIVEHFKKKYPNVPIDIIFHELTEQLILKCMTENCCNIKGFGKFYMFKIFSNRTKKNSIRFKFVKSATFMKNICKDKYLLNNLPTKNNVPFTEVNEDKCSDENCIKAKQENLELIKILNNQNKENEQNSSMKILIEDIINSI